MVNKLGVIFSVLVFLGGCDVGAPESAVRTYFTPGPDCENNIILELNRASDSVDIAVYAITNRRIVDAVLDAHRRGVVVRVITDRTQFGGKKSLVTQLRNAGIPVATNKKHKIMHHKFAVFDARHVFSGSYNWTAAASNANAENCNFFDTSAIEYQRRFEFLWRFYIHEN